MDDYETYEEPRSRLWLWILILLLLAFVGGIVATGYVVAHNRHIAGWLHLEPVAQARAEAQMARRIVVQPQPAPAPAPKAAAPSDPVVQSRLDALDAKVNDIQQQARAATGDASRAEGLLVAFAARRALDRGMGLGYIEGLLRQRFGKTQPQAVAAIISAAQQPVTLSDLQTDLDAIAPRLAAGGGSPHEGWWDAFRRQLGSLIVVRHAGEVSPLPADRVERAQRMLEAGQVDAALAEIVRLPDHRAAGKWIGEARRYIISRSALDRIETAALLDPATSAGGGPVPGWPVSAQPQHPPAVLKPAPGSPLDKAVH